MVVAAAPSGQDFTFGGTWPFEPHWLETDGVHIHYVDEGPRDGEPVVMLHGVPTWSYLYRRFIPALASAGYRAIAYDQLGFGRSDKPLSTEEYSIDEMGARSISPASSARFSSVGTPATSSTSASSRKKTGAMFT